MFDHILESPRTKWDFRKLAAETTAAQIRWSLRSSRPVYIRPHGLYMSIVEEKHTRVAMRGVEGGASGGRPGASVRRTWVSGTTKVVIVRSLEDELVLEHAVLTMT
jgi:hypothetical protein